MELIKFCAFEGRCASLLSMMPCSAYHSNPISYFCIESNSIEFSWKTRLTRRILRNCMVSYSSFVDCEIGLLLVFMTMWEMSKYWGIYFITHSSNVFIVSFNGSIEWHFLAKLEYQLDYEGGNLFICTRRLIFGSEFLVQVMVNCTNVQTIWEKIQLDGISNKYIVAIVDQIV